MTRSLVTGGSGYFGSLLVGQLLERGDQVRVLDIDPHGEHGDDVEVIVADVRDAGSVDRAVAGCDVVYHNVAQVPLAGASPELWSVNVDGTAVLLDRAMRAGVGKVVHTSSSAVFGVPGENPVLPSTVPSPAEDYGRAKLAAEWACLRAATAGLDVTIVRPRTILGHGRLGIFGILFDWIADGADPFVLGDGSNRYQFVHADDLARLCIAAAEHRGPALFNGGTDRFGSMESAVAAVCAHAGTGATVRHLPARPAALAMRLSARLGLTPFAPYHWLMYHREMWFDLDHITATLDWTPRYSNEEMFVDSYDWYLAHRDDAHGSAASSPHRSVARGILLGALKSATKWR